MQRRAAGRLMNQKKIPVLIADDSEDDQFFFKRAAAKLEKLEIVGSVRDGEDLLAYLSGAAAYADRTRFPLPELLLLDLQMPKRNGFDVLEWLKENTNMPDMIVVVVSGSSQDTDIRKALALGADYYQAKPAEPQSWTAMLQAIEFYASRHRRESQT
jgi:CheY-like chemotaxis protein